MHVLNRVIAKSADMGALPRSTRPLSPALEGGMYVVPDGFLEQRGYPKARVDEPRRAGRERGAA
jgi:hypothetical protein